MKDIEDIKVVQYFQIQETGMAKKGRGHDFCTGSECWYGPN